MKNIIKYIGLFLFSYVGLVMLIAIASVSASVLVSSCCFSATEEVCFYYADENCSWMSDKILVAKNLPYPYIYEIEDGRFAGAIYPYSLKLVEEDYFAASVLDLLYKGSNNGTQKEIGEFLSHFNWNKFMEECRNIDDTTKLNKSKIANAIATDSFSKSLLK